jgi:hypothetical protein
MLKIAAILCALALPAAADDYKGKTVNLDFKQAPLSDVLHLLTDVGNVNAVLVDTGPVAIDIKVNNTPWDKAIVDAIALAKLAYAKSGNVYIVGPQATIDAYKKQATRKYTGASARIDIVDADATDALALLSAVTGKAYGARPGAPHRAHLHVKNVPADQIAELVLLQTGGAAADKPAMPAKRTDCAAPAVKAGDLVLGAIAESGTTQAGLFVDGKDACLFDKHDCVGVGRFEVHAIGHDYVEVADKPPIKIDLHPVGP